MWWYTRRNQISSFGETSNFARKPCYHLQSPSTALCTGLNRASVVCRGQLKCDGTRAEIRFRLSAKGTSLFKSAGGRQFSRLLAAEVCASAVVMLDTPCSEVECKTTVYPLPSHISPSLPLPCVTVCHQVSTGLYLS